MRASPFRSVSAHACVRAHSCVEQKPLSGYMLFAKSQRGEILKKSPGLAFGEVRAPPPPLPPSPDAEVRAPLPPFPRPPRCALPPRPFPPSPDALPRASQGLTPTRA